MSSPDVSFETITSPSLDFADLAQQIGYAAWSARFTQRSDAEIRQMFAPDGDERSVNATKSLDRMRGKADYGKFVGSVALIEGQPIGFGWAADDTTESSQQTSIKTEIGEKPYVWIAHVNVLPNFQRAGTGKNLLKQILEGFDEDQRPTAYVFDENQPTLRMFQKIGFLLNPSQPRVKYDYFGEHAEPVHQWRLEASSTTEVISLINLG